MCGTRAGLRVAVFVSWGTEGTRAASGHLPFSHEGQVGMCCRQHRFYPSCQVWFGSYWLVGCGCQGPCGGVTAGILTCFWELCRSQAACSCLQHSVCSVLFTAQKYTLEEHYSASVFTIHAQKPDFFEGTSVFRDAMGHPGSSEQHSRHCTPFLAT